jgi:hypothetical protein
MYDDVLLLGDKLLDHVYTSAKTGEVVRETHSIRRAGMSFVRRLIISQPN